MKAGKHTRRTMFWAMAAALCMGCLTTLVLLMDVHPAIRPYTPLILVQPSAACWQYYAP